MTFPKIRLSMLTPLGAYQAWETSRVGIQDYSPELVQLINKSAVEFNRVGYDQVILKIQKLIKKLFLKDLKTGEGSLPFFLAFYYWICQKIDLIEVNQPESSRLLILRDQLLDAFLNMRYPDMVAIPQEEFLRLLREVNDTLVSLGDTQKQDRSWEELGSMLYQHRFLLEAAFQNIVVREQSTFMPIECDLMQQMLIAKKIKTQISLDLDDLIRRMNEFNIFDHPRMNESFVDFREEAKKAVEVTQQEIAAFDWEQMDHNPVFSDNYELVHQRFHFFRRYEKTLISGLQEVLKNQEEGIFLEFAPDRSIQSKVPQVILRNRNEVQAMLDYAVAKRHLHLHYDAKISAPRFHLVTILSSIRETKERNPKKWAMEWPKAIQEWQKKIDAPPALSIQEIDRLWESEKPAAKKGAVKAKASKPKAPVRVAKWAVVVKTESMPALPERSLSSMIQEVQSSGLSTDYTMNALKQARIYEIDLLLLQRMLKNRLSKEQLSPASILSIRVSALYLEQLFRSEVLDWKNDPEASLRIHNLRLFDSLVAKKAEPLVNRLFLAHYWVDYPEEQWKKWNRTHQTPPELLSQMQMNGSFNQESIQALIQEVLQLGRTWIEEKTKGHAVQLLPEHASLREMPSISLTQIKKKIRCWSPSEREIMERLLRMIDFCFKTPVQASFQIRHGLHWMHLSLEYALRLAVQRKTGVMPRSHNLIELADSAQIALSNEERQYLSTYFQTARPLSSYLYDWADPTKLLDQLLLQVDQGEEVPSSDVLKLLVNGFSPLLAKVIVGS